ncbi:BatD family protein [Bacteroides propionicifaciens]|uniref:BatD family protein n=1 Tax=Bacteroides propionicifaciens TaxID=392838 RepID=UPI00037B8127|nr:BatD family protein [Bacteroides propionicifaciens]
MIKVIQKSKALGLLLFIFLFSGHQLYAADEITFTAKAPSSVEMESQFEVAYTVNTNQVNDFRAPSFDNFDVLIGPSRSVQSYTSIVNGKTSHVNNMTYTYILMPKKEGTFTLPGASVTIKGKSFTSNSLSIKVLPKDKSGNSNQQQGSSRSNARGGQISSSDLFLVGNLSKTKVFEQEAVLLTYKLYVASVSVSSIRPVKIPDFSGFHSQELDLSNSDRWDLENYKGRNYRTAVLQQVVLYPQRSGKLTIEPAQYEVSVEQPMEIDDPFDAFFNMRTSNTVRKNISSPNITVDVSSLPSGKPLDFSGAVGNFNLSASINTQEVKANEAITIKLVLSGTGNIKLISNPEVNFPSDFEIYDPKVEDQFRITANGLSGNRVIEYLAIPRHEGNFKIEPIKFSYFDLKSKSYKTLTTQEFSLKVTKGEGAGNGTGAVVGNYTNQEELKILAEDIRFIKMNDVELYPREQFFYGSWGYRLLFIIPSLVFLVFLIIYSKRVKQYSNTAFVKTKKANKVAKSRMKSAAKLLHSGSKELFYNEVLRGLWGYISDKLTIPLSKLSKDNIEEELNNSGVSPDLTADFIRTLNECEFAKFAPGEDDQAMDKILQDATEIIGRIENSIKIN